jgi:hypothetical protein
VGLQLSQRKAPSLCQPLEMRVNSITGIKTLLDLGPKIAHAVAAKPDGLLPENILYSLRHFGMRQ